MDIKGSKGGGKIFSNIDDMVTHLDNYHPPATNRRSGFTAHGLEGGW